MRLGHDAAIFGAFFNYTSGVKQLTRGRASRSEQPHGQRDKTRVEHGAPGLVTDAHYFFGDVEGVLFGIEPTAQVAALEADNVGGRAWGWLRAG